MTDKDEPHVRAGFKAWKAFWHLLTDELFDVIRCHLFGTGVATSFLERPFGALASRLSGSAVVVDSATPQQLM